MQRLQFVFINIIVLATCGLVYELLAGTLASYVLGDSVTQFSLIIGLYMSAMGVGAWLSRYVGDDLGRRFVDVQLGVALFGGCAAAVQFLAFARLSYFEVVLYAMVFVTGVLVGLEIPLLMRLIENRLNFGDMVSRVLAFDYAGALLAAILFPMFFVPRLGLLRTSFVFGLLNAAVALWATWQFRAAIAGGAVGLRLRAAAAIALMVVGIVKADDVTSIAEASLFTGEVIYAKSTPYQRIVITRAPGGFNLYLNGNLQFAASDEYRYHEALVHPVFSENPAARHVLICGGGDGLALREVLSYPTVESVTLVDLDPDMTTLFKRFPALADLNHHSFDDPRVRVINMDAMLWLAEPGDRFDAAIVDFPDPNNFALGKLYTTRFYNLLKARLAPDAAVSIQCTSPVFARTSYWCIVRTLEAAGLFVQPYQMTVPAFGVWGFALARLAPFEPPTHVRPGLRALDDRVLSAMFVFGPDVGPVDVEINRLDNQALVRYYEAEWRRWE